MRKLFGLMLVACVISCDEEGDDPIVSLPVLSTSEISQLTKTSAISGGEISSDGGGKIFNRGICYSISSNPTVENNVVPNAGGTGSFVSTMTGLAEGTTYYVRAYAMNDAGTAYGNEISFSTEQTTIPTVATAAMSSITKKTAVSGGNVTTDGGATVTARGICYSTNQTPTISDHVIAAGSGQGNFVANMSELTAGTMYYVRAFATNAAGTSYGNEISFNTLPAEAPTIIGKDVSLITSSSGRSGGEIISDGGAMLIESGICWSTSPNPTINANKIVQQTASNNFELSITGLTKSTTYYVRAFATNSAGTAYGSEKSFTTFSIAIGDNYQGGIVFYIDQTGDHGLVVAEADLPTNMQWGCPSVNISTSSAVGEGSQNTANILAGCTSSGIAARECSDLTAAGYTDWFLPSVDEWQLIHDNLFVNGLGNFIPNGIYWTSTQFNDVYAVAYDAVHHMPFNPEKTNPLFVRAVRAF